MKELGKTSRKTCKKNTKCTNAAGNFIFNLASLTVRNGSFRKGLRNWGPERWKRESRPGFSCQRYSFVRACGCWGREHSNHVTWTPTPTTVQRILSGPLYSALRLVGLFVCTTVRVQTPLFIGRTVDNLNYTIESLLIIYSWKSKSFFFIPCWLQGS